ncbi:22616_t:CDS:2 [Gigaspora margarita]|uniref:22616_t:CDS:1 n=1 Tax=Gigaspora margarita TaxID=4874 RepID=A0ABM8W3L1_GIGMA|nr:22616_t:CDS:2 [Gigaspora margarita]
MNRENEAINNSEKNNIKTEDPNSFLGNLENFENLRYLNYLVENYKLSDKKLIEALELLSDPSLFKVYKKNIIVRLELHLRTCKAILEVVTYFAITLEYELRDKFNNSLNNFANIYYEIINHKSENTYMNYKNYNINFLLIHLRDISRSTKLNNTFDIKVTLDKVLQNNYSTKKFLKKEEITKFDEANSCNQILYELLSLNYSLNFTNNTIYKVLQYYKEDYLFEFIWKYTYLSIEHNVETKFDISKILNNQEEFIEILNGKGLANPPATLLFGILDFAQNLCKKTTHVVTLVYSYFLGIEALQKSNCAYIWFKSVELLLYLSSKEPGLFQELVQNKINNFKTLNNSQEFKDILQYVTRKLELEDEFLKNLNLTKNEKIFVQNFTTEKSIKLLIEIVIDRLSCPVTRKITGDFFILLCSHSISHQFKIQNFKCPFCKADIESDSIYNLSQNAILRGLCKFIEQDGYVFSAETDSYMKISENIPRGPKLSKKIYSKVMLFAFEKADIAEKQFEYPIAIMWFTRVLHFYPKSYSIQCRRAIAFLKLKMYLKAINDLTTAIKLKPSKSLAYIYRSKIYIVYKNFDNALHDIEEALKIDPDNKDACLEKEKICEYKKQTGNIDRPIIMQGAVLILYPPTPPEDWTRPSIKDVSDRLEELIEIGFELSYTIIGDIMQLFEQRLPAIGNTLIEAFIQARNDKKENLLSKCLIEALKPNRKLKGIEVFEFLYRTIDGDKEAKFLDTMNFLLENKSNNNTLDNNNGPFKPLEFSTMYYNWCLKRFGENATITEMCFEDILNTRISIDNYYKQNQNNQVPAGLMQDKFKNECEVFKIYCNARNFFKPSHLPIICQAIHEDILKTLFEYYLAILFDIQTLHTLQPIENFDLNVKLSVSTIEKKSLFRNETYKDEWSIKLEELYDEINSGSLKGTNEFREYLKRFWEEYIKKV